MQIAKNKFFFLLICLISSNLYHNIKCSKIVDCDHQPFDDYTYYEETKQELTDEINDVNDYMHMVADQLNNDDVIVVRAMRTIFPTTDTDHTLISDILEFEVEDFACDQPKGNTTTSMETVPFARYTEKDENTSLVDKEMREIEQHYCLVDEKSPVDNNIPAKNFTSTNVEESEIIIPVRDLQREL